MEKRRITNEIIKQRLLYEIKNCGFKKKDIALKTGVKPTMITAYTNSKKMPSLETFANLCLELKLDANYVLGIRDFEDN